MTTATRYPYLNNCNTGSFITNFHEVIMAAIANGGVFDEDYADIFVLTKTPEGSRCEYVLNFA